MATSLSKPEIELAECNTAVAAPSSTESEIESRAPGRDALQALLAFSSLHEQVRRRRAGVGDNGNSGSGADDDPDEFVLYEVLQLVAARARALTGADGVAIALVQEGQIICRATSGPIAPDLGVRLDPNSGISGACFRSAQTVRCDDTENDPRVNVQASRRLNTRSVVAVPLCGRRSVVGMIEAFATEAYGFNDSDVRSLSLLAELILGAMKPEEEERLEAWSPVVIHTPRPAPPVPAAPMPPEAERPAVEENVLPAQATAELQPLEFEPVPEPEPAAELPLDEESAVSMRGLWVAVSLAAVAVVLAAGFSWRLHSKNMTSAAAAPEAVLATNSPVLAPPPAPSPATVQSAPELSNPISPEDAQRNILPQVTGVRHWESDDSTTVAIDLQDQVQYEVHRLTDPERIYFDLHDTVLSPGLSGKTIEVADPLLIRIRIAQPVPGVSRVVLETKGVSTFSVSLEANPYRLVAEIRSNAAGSHPKAKIDLLRPDTGTESDKLTSATRPLSKEDMQLRARVPKLRIVVDAGHGGWDLGTVGRRGLLEKDLVLDIAQRLGDLLGSRLGTDVVYTRGNDSYVPLEKRAEIANQAQADLFVSIHANYSDYASARGVETYYTNYSTPTNSLEIEKRENATAQDVPATAVLTGVALKERTLESRRLAASVERALYGTLAAKNPGIRDRGVKEAGFVVLTGTSMPAILAEISFVSSPTDEFKLQSSAYREQIAEALYKGVARYAASSSRAKLAKASGKPAGR